MRSLKTFVGHFILKDEHYYLDIFLSAFPPCLNHELLSTHGYYFKTSFELIDKIKINVRYFRILTGSHGRVTVLSSLPSHMAAAYSNGSCRGEWGR